MLASDFEAAATQANRIFSMSDEFTLSQRPPRGGWSPVECIEHLNITARQFQPLLENARRAVAALPKATAPYRMAMKERALKWFLEPPYRMSVKTIAAFNPLDGKTGAEVFKEFTDWQSKLKTFVESCEGMAVDRVQIVSPFDARMKYSLWAALNILAAHQRRHLWQAEQILAKRQ